MSEFVVVSDTSPLIHLARADQFLLIRSLYPSLLLPPAVWREVVEEGNGRAGEAEVRAAVDSGWMEVRPPQNRSMLRFLKSELDEGEAESLALAAQVRAGLLLVDETPARERAALMNLPFTGTVGVLIRAKTAGLVSELRPVLDRMREQSFRLSDRLYDRVLESVNEAPS